MERVTRLELATHSLGSYCSTTELYPQYVLLIYYITNHQKGQGESAQAAQKISVACIMKLNTKENDSALTFLCKYVSIKLKKDIASSVHAGTLKEKPRDRNSRGFLFVGLAVCYFLLSNHLQI